MLRLILAKKNPSTDHAAQSANEKRHQNPFDNQQNKRKHERWICTIPVCISLVRFISPMTIPSCNRLETNKIFIFNCCYCFNLGLQLIFNNKPYQKQQLYRLEIQRFESIQSLAPAPSKT